MSNSVNTSIALSCPNLPAWDGDRSTNYLNVRKRLVTCLLVGRQINTQELQANSALIPLLSVMNADIDDLQVTNLQVTGTMQLCPGSNMGTLLVTDSKANTVCFDPVTTGATPGQFLQYTGTAPYGLTWTNISGSGACTDHQKLTVGLNNTSTVCIRPGEIPFGAPGSSGHILSFDGAITQTSSSAVTPSGVQFGPPAPGSDALVTFDASLLTNGMPKWTLPPSGSNSMLYYDIGLPAGSRLRWTTSGSANSILRINTVGGGVPQWLPPPAGSGPLLYFDGTELKWSPSGASENVLVMSGTDPTWIPNPVTDSVLAHQSGVTQWVTGSIPPNGTLDGDLLTWNTGTNSWVTFNCSNANELIAGNGGGGYQCITAPGSSSSLLYFDGINITWSAGGNNENVLIVQGGVPTWIPNPVSDSVLAHQSGITQWVTGSVLPNGSTSGDLLVWDGGLNMWTTFNCANVNEMIIGNGGGGYQCITAPTAVNTFLYYDGVNVTWTANAGGAQQVMYINAVGQPDWLPNPPTNATLVHAGGVTQWDTTAFISGSGLSAGDLIYWDGASWVPVNCTGTGFSNSIIVSAPGNSYTCITASLNNSIMYYDAAATLLTWSGAGASENVFIVNSSGQPDWLANPGSDAVLVHETGITGWNNAIGGSITDPVYLTHDGTNFAWSNPFPVIVVATSHQLLNLTGSSAIPPTYSAAHAKISWNFVSPPSTSSITTAVTDITLNTTGVYVFSGTVVVRRNGSGSQTSFVVYLGNDTTSTLVNYVVTNRLNGGQIGHLSFTFPVSAAVAGESYSFRCYTNNTNGTSRQVLANVGGLTITRVA